MAFADAGIEFAYAGAATHVVLTDQRGEGSGPGGILGIGGEADSDNSFGGQIDGD